jgi:hypothetical protein
VIRRGTSGCAPVAGAFILSAALLDRIVENIEAKMQLDGGRRHLFLGEAERELRHAGRSSV